MFNGWSVEGPPAMGSTVATGWLHPAKPSTKSQIDCRNLLPVVEVKNWHSCCTLICFLSTIH